MVKIRTLALLVVVAHWIVAIWHLFLAAAILSGPNNQVNWLAVTLITLGHWAVAVALWALGGRLTGLALLVFFLAAMGADLYEHFLQASANNIFMVSPGVQAAWFNTSVFALLAFEIAGCLLGILLLGGRKGTTHNRRNTILGKQRFRGSWLRMGRPSHIQLTNL